MAGSRPMVELCAEVTNCGNVTGRTAFCRRNELQIVVCGRIAFVRRNEQHALGGGPPAIEILK